MNEFEWKHLKERTLCKTLCVTKVDLIILSFILSVDVFLWLEVRGNSQTFRWRERNFVREQKDI